VPRPSILVVEDNEIEQKLLKLLLERFGYDAVMASSGEEAANHAAGGEFAVILMDWQIHDIDGLECTRRIRELQRKHGRYVPIIAVTARAMTGDRQKCLNAGMDDYLSKPYTAKQLEELLQHWASTDKSLTG